MLLNFSGALGNFFILMALKVTCVLSLFLLPSQRCFEDRSHSRTSGVKLSNELPPLGLLFNLVEVVNDDVDRRRLQNFRFIGEAGREYFDD